MYIFTSSLRSSNDQIHKLSSKLDFGTYHIVQQTLRVVLKDFSLNVKAATLTFIFGRGSAISSAKQGKSGSMCKVFGPRKRACIS